MSSTSDDELRSKIAEYGNFITKTLQPQLQTAVEAKEETEAEISEYLALQKKIQQVMSTIDSKTTSDLSMNAMVDLAHQAWVIQLKDQVVAIITRK